MSFSVDFKGKVALITGSSSGIGAATALLFAKSGAYVVVTGRNVNNVSQVAKHCLDVSPTKLKPLEVVADVSNEDDCKRLITSTVDAFGKLDILVNNAGFAINSGILKDKDFIENYKKIFETNLNSVIYLTKYSVKHLVITKGNIINISSVNAYIPALDCSSYCMSKCAIDMFTKCMAVELASKGIRVNSVCPGAVRTKIIERTGIAKVYADAEFDSLAKIYPVGRVGEGVDIAKVILFLASDGSLFATGSIVVADGGHMAASIGGGIDTGMG